MRRGRGEGGGGAYQREEVPEEIGAADRSTLKVGEGYVELDQALLRNLGQALGLGLPLVGVHLLQELGLLGQRRRHLRLVRLGDLEVGRADFEQPERLAQAPDLVPVFHVLVVVLALPPVCLGAEEALLGLKTEFGSHNIG